MPATLATPTSVYSDLGASDMLSRLQSEPVRPVTVPVGQDSQPRDENIQPSDRISLSQEGMRRSRRAGSTAPVQGRDPETTQDFRTQNLSQEELRAVQQLKQRDREVRAHEQAHLSAAGQYAAGGPSYTYQTGPDGRRYAIGGEVPIDVSKERTPEQTIRKMEVVQHAALAPANPSGADRRIAAAAAMKKAEAMRELQAQKQSSDHPSEISTKESSGKSQRPDPDFAETGIPANRPMIRSRFQAVYA